MHTVTPMVAVMTDIVTGTAGVAGMGLQGVTQRGSVEVGNLKTEAFDLGIKVTIKSSKLYANSVHKGK